MAKEASRYFMAVEDGETLDILIYGDITSWEWWDSDVSGYSLAKQIQESQASNIRVRINSYGGEVAEGLAIYNSLRDSGAHVTTICDGFACSAASVVFMAGDERIINDASLLMIHNAWSYASGNAKELRKVAEDLDRISTAAANTYRARMTITEGELQMLLDNESWILPEEAVSYGFATAIGRSEEKEKQQYSARGRVYAELTGRAPAKQREPETSKPAEPKKWEKKKPQKPKEEPEKVSGFSRVFSGFMNR